jgi:Tol biopolymer transport system component
LKIAASVLLGALMAFCVVAAHAQQVIMFSADATPVHAQLFIANADGSGERPLLPLSGMDYSPLLSADGKWAVFTSERNGSADIYRVHLDGSGLERLTDDPAFDDQAVLSPDGETLAFVSSRGSGRAHIWLLDLASRRARLLTPNSGSDFRPAWSPDGKWLAFTSDRDSNAGHLPGRWERLQSLGVYVIHPDGSGLRRVTRGRGVAGSPRWSLDGKRIYYYEATELGAWYAEFGVEAKGTTQIVSIDIADGSVIQHTTGDGVRVAPQPLAHDALGYLAKLKDGNVIRVVQHDSKQVESQPGKIQGPSWSSDGKQVVYYKFTESDSPEVLPAFAREPGFRLVKLAEGMAFPAISPQGDQIAVTTGKFDTLTLMKLDGNDRKIVLSKKDGLVLAPEWSPDGKRVAFSQGMYFRFGAHPVGQVALINTDGTGLQSVSVDGTNSGFPSWSPDGQKIVYEQDGHLVVLTVASNDRVNLTSPGGQRDNFPKWSPKGDWIVFTSDRDGDEQFRIYLIRPDGTDLHKLTDSPGDAHCNWSPDGKSVVFASARMGFKDERALSTTPQPYGEIFTIGVDGTGLRQLTDNQWEEGTPIWFSEPDGKLASSK